MIRAARSVVSITEESIRTVRAAHPRTGGSKASDGRRTGESDRRIIGTDPERSMAESPWLVSPSRPSDRVPGGMSRSAVNHGAPRLKVDTSRRAWIRCGARERSDLPGFQARGSVVERFLDTEEVDGSIPSAPTRPAGVLHFFDIDYFKDRTRFDDPPPTHLPLDAVV